jgi:hypothetical protein
MKNYLPSNLKEFNFHDPILFYFLIAPLRAIDSALDFHVVERIIETPPIDWDTRFDQDRIRSFEFNSEHYVDAVVTPWYEGKVSIPSKNIYYGDFITPMTPASKYPAKKYGTYAEYVRKKDVQDF